VSAAIFYTADEVAAVLRISENTVKGLATKQQLPGAFKVGSQWRFDREKLEAYVGRTLPNPGTQQEGLSQ
jgi:excisionase family DNA binding protein